MGSVELVVWILLACTPIYTGSTSPELKSKIPLVTATASNVWAGKAAWRAIDGNYGTYSLAGPNKEQETWFTVSLDKVHCVAMVTVFWESYFPEAGNRTTFTCTENRCTCNRDTNCGDNITLLVYSTTDQISRDQARDLPSVVACGLGDIIKVLDPKGWGFKVFEIMATAQLADCREYTPAWNSVDMEPLIPVPHNSHVTMGCRSGYRNVGGSRGICRDGQIVLESAPPDCVVEYIDAMVTAEGAHSREHQSRRYKAHTRK